MRLSSRPRRIYRYILFLLFFYFVFRRIIQLNLSLASSLKFPDLDGIFIFIYLFVIMALSVYVFIFRMTRAKMERFSERPVVEEEKN